MNLQEQYLEEIQSIERYFAFTTTGSFLFGVCNDEELIANINHQIEFSLQAKGKSIVIHSFKNPNPDTPTLQHFRNTIAQYPQIDGIIMMDAEWEQQKNNYLYTQINFAREFFLEFKVPMFFWMSQQAIKQFVQQAIDFYNQRTMADISFVDHNIQSKQLFEEYKAEQIIKHNPSKAKFEPRLKLLQKQLHQAEEAGWDKKIIANDIVIELLRIYVELPNMNDGIAYLLEEYKNEFDTTKPEANFILGRSYRYFNYLDKAENYYVEATKGYRLINNLVGLGASFNNLAELNIKKKETKKAESNYIEALAIARNLAEKKPEMYLSKLALTLSNLANTYTENGNYSNANLAYEEALDIRRKLAKEKSSVHLSDLAKTLNNFAEFFRRTKEYTKAEVLNQQALEIRRQLSKEQPQVYLSDLATTLNNLAILHKNKKEYSLSEKEFLESIEIRRRLANTQPEICLPYLANSIKNIATLYADTKEKEKSIFHLKVALEILQYQQHLPQCQDYIKKCFTVLNDWQISPQQFLQENNIAIDYEKYKDN